MKSKVFNVYASHTVELWKSLGVHFPDIWLLEMLEAKALAFTSQRGREWVKFIPSTFDRHAYWSCNVPHETRAFCITKIDTYRKEKADPISFFHVPHMLLYLVWNALMVYGSISPRINLWLKCCYTNDVLWLCSNLCDNARCGVKNQLTFGHEIKHWYYK